MTLKVVLMMAAAVFIISAAAQHSPMSSLEAAPPGPGPDCLTAVTNISDCLPYVRNGSSMTVPDKPCCPEFAGLLENNPMCLCRLIADPDNLGIDLSRALTLPNLCKLTLPPLSSCPAKMSPDGDAGSTSPSTNDQNTASTNDQNTASSVMLSRLLTLGCSAVTCFVHHSFMLIL